MTPFALFLFVFVQTCTAMPFSSDLQQQQQPPAPPPTAYYNAQAEDVAEPAYYNAQADVAEQRVMSEIGNLLQQL
jgi:hypothetical protein